MATKTGPTRFSICQKMPLLKDMGHTFAPLNIPNISSLFYLFIFFIVPHWWARNQNWTENLGAGGCHSPDDLETTGRRKNLHIVGLPGEDEENDPTPFFETWLLKILHIETKTGRGKSERAHRSLAPNPFLHSKTTVSAGSAP